MSTLLTRDQILEASDIQTQRVAVPEWGGEVLVRGMTGAERDAVEQGMLGKDGKVSNVIGLRGRVLMFCVVDEAGKRLFQKSDIDALSAKSAAGLERVFDVARQLSGMTQAEVAELEKN
jgi:hypothetical protein